MQLPNDYSTLRKILAETIQSFAKHNEEWDEINKIALDILQAPGNPVKSDLSHKVIAFTDNLKKNRPILELFYRCCSPKYQKICALAEELKKTESPKQPEIETSIEQETHNWTGFTTSPLLVDRLEEEMEQAPHCGVRVEQFLEVCMGSADGLGACIYAIEHNPKLRDQLIADCQVADNPAKYRKELLDALRLPNVRESLPILTAGLLIEEKKFTEAFDIIKKIPNRNHKIDLFLTMIQAESPEGLQVCKDRIHEEGAELCKLLESACQENGSSQANLLKADLETRIIPSFSKVMTPTAIASRLLQIMSNMDPHLEETASTNPLEIKPSIEQEPYDWMGFTPKTPIDPLLIKELEEIKKEPLIYMKIHYFLNMCKESVDGLEACIEKIKNDPEMRAALSEEQTGHPKAQLLRDALLPSKDIGESLPILTFNLLIEEGKFTEAFDIIKSISNREKKIALLLQMIETDEGLEVCQSRIQEEGLEICELLKSACQESTSPKRAQMKEALIDTIIPHLSTDTGLDIPFPRYDNKVPEQFDAILPQVLPEKHAVKIKGNYEWVNKQLFSAARKITHCVSPDKVQVSISQEGKVTSLSFDNPSKAVSFETQIPVLGTVKCGISKIDYDEDTKQITVRLSVKETDKNEWHPEYKECSFTEEEFSSLWRDIHKSPW